MKCKLARKMLADYVNDVLEPEDSRLIQEHIAECDPCRRELDVLKKVLRLIDDVKVEYPPASVWENFLHDLHRRIESEAALAFKKQQKRFLYLLPGWIASAAAVVLVIFVSAMLGYYPFAGSVRSQGAKEDIEVVQDSSPSLVEYSSEPVLVAGMISEVLITEVEAAELKKLDIFTRSETLTPPYYYHDSDSLIDTTGEAGDTQDDEGFIQFLENKLSEFGENPMIESEDVEFETI
jgi:hypothetical protein